LKNAALASTIMHLEKTSFDQDPIGGEITLKVLQKISKLHPERHLIRIEVL
jgi:hypothetical protein